MIKKLTEEFSPELNEIKRLMKEAISESPGHTGMREILTDNADNPGKMIRAILILLSAGDHSDECRGELLATGAALEMIHLSSLILDDVIDDSPLRRGKETVQKRFGKPIALCSGDYLFTAALHWLCKKGYHETAEDLMEAIQVICDGEMIQHENRGKTAVSEEEYIRAIRGKTAYGFFTACKQGCRIAGRSKKEREVLEKYGDLLGTMFQLKDDLLDWTKNETQLGKPVNLDFAEGVYTLPAIYTFSQEGYGDKLRAFAEKEDLTEDDHKELRGLVTESGGIAYSARYLKGLGDKAREVLGEMPESFYTDNLRGIIHTMEEE